ncbi:MAG TPA: hypothetical protein VGK20_16335 [Candidatus Binatia bacterium]|jgi:hypothetical protein
MQRAILAILVAIVLVAGSRAAQASPDTLTTCGSTVSNAVLAADLDCSSSSGWAVTITPGGSLDLAGHILTGTPSRGTSGSGYAFGGGIHCQGNCTITGSGGAIVSSPGLPAETWYNTGVYSDTSLKTDTITITDAHITGWTGMGLFGTGSANLSNCTVAGNDYGVVVWWQLTMDTCFVTNNTGEGAHVGRGTISNSTFDGNNYDAVYALGRINFVNSTISGSNYLGMFAGKLVASGSSITGSCIAPYGEPCADIQGVHRPRLRTSSCGTSARFTDDPAAPSWHVCGQD